MFEIYLPIFKVKLQSHRARLILPSTGYLVISGIILAHHSAGGGAIGIQEAESSAAKYCAIHRQPPITKNYQVLSVNSANVEELCLRRWQEVKMPPLHRCQEQKMRFQTRGPCLVELHNSSALHLVAYVTSCRNCLV